VNQNVKEIFKLRGNRYREEQAHYAVLTVPVEELAMCSTALCLQSSGSNEGENMDALLQDCTIEEHRGVVRFLWAEEAKSVEIHRRMLVQYGQSTMSQRKVYEWVERFKSGRTRVTYEGRSDRTSTSRTQDHKSSRKASSPQEYRNL